MSSIQHDDARSLDARPPASQRPAHLRIRGKTVPLREVVSDLLPDARRSTAVRVRSNATRHVLWASIATLQVTRQRPCNNPIMHVCHLSNKSGWQGHAVRKCPHHAAHLEHELGACDGIRGEHVRDVGMVQQERRRNQRMHLRARHMHNMSAQVSSTAGDVRALTSRAPRRHFPMFGHAREVAIEQVLKSQQHAEANY